MALKTPGTLKYKVTIPATFTNEFAAAYGSVAAPMGGMGQSGLGRRHGIEGLLRFTQPQTIARQRWISIGPKFGFDEEQWTKLLSKSLLILKRLRIR